MAGRFSYDQDHDGRAAKHGKITKESYHEYISNLRAECKDRLDKAGVSEKNVGDISRYAADSYKNGIYDEVEAEFATKKLLKKR